MDTQACVLFAQPLTKVPTECICSWQITNGSQRIFLLWTWMMTSSGLMTRAMCLRQWTGLTFRSYSILSWNPRETPRHLTRVTPSLQAMKELLLTTSIPISTKIQLTSLPTVETPAALLKQKDNWGTYLVMLQMHFPLWLLYFLTKIQRKWKIFQIA
ncbi:L* protein [Rat theilovirus 1]|uniref:L* protein n=1 Tax=Rat theilovirus 1 TaxID=529419 RepID=B5SXL9_9PICO|nr:L* protein [Rat theilovirus 1]